MNQEYLDLLLKNNIELSKNPWCFPKKIYPEVNQNYGWKIHISATILNATEVASTFFSLNDSLNLDFKILSSLSILERINLGQYGNSQVGKLITIYPPQNRIEKLLNILSYHFKKFQGISVGSDYQYMLSSNIYYRYGTIIADENNIDKRNKNLLPDTIPIFDFHIPRLKELPKRYIVLTILKQQGTHACYLGLDLATQKKVIIRYATPNHNVDEVGIDTIDRLHNSIKVMKTNLSDNFEKVIDYFYIDQSFVLITKAYEGMSVEKFLMENTKLKFNTKILLFKKMYDLITQLHTNNIIFRDVSFGNFIINPADFSVYLIDFEYSIITTNNKSYAGCPITTAGTYGFLNYKYTQIDAGIDYFALSNVLYYLFHFGEYLNYIENIKIDTSLDEIDRLTDKQSSLPPKVQTGFNTLRHFKPLPSNYLQSIL